MTTSLNDLLDDRRDDTVVIDAGDRVDDLFEDDALLAPARTSRLTLVLVALLILMVGVFAGVQIERLLGGMPMGAPPASASTR